MLYHGAQRVKLPNLSKISRLLSPLAIFLRFQAFQRYMISDVVFWWKVDLNFGLFAATLCRPGVTIPRKKTRNHEKDPGKTEKDFIFNRILFICYSNPILYISMCSKHVFASIFYVNYRNTAYSSLECSVPDLLSLGTSAPPGELNIIYLYS